MHEPGNQFFLWTQEQKDRQTDDFSILKFVCYLFATNWTVNQVEKFLKISPVGEMLDLDG